MRYAPAAFYLALVLAWFFVPGAMGIPKYVFPGLNEVLQEFSRAREPLALNTYVTAIEALIGVFLGCLFGLMVGVGMAASRTVERITMPLVIGSNAVPVVAIAPLIILWFGYGMLSKVIVAAFLSFFPIALSAFDGLQPRDKNAESLFLVMGATPQQYFLKYRLPNALPSILTGLKISAVLAVIGAVVSEFIGSDSGLGFGMLQARYSLNTPRLFCYMIVSCALGLSVYYAFLGLERFVTSRRRWCGTQRLG